MESKAPIQQLIFEREEKEQLQKGKNGKINEEVLGRRGGKEETHYLRKVDRENAVGNQELRLEQCLREISGGVN